MAQRRKSLALALMLSASPLIANCAISDSKSSKQIITPGAVNATAGTLKTDQHQDPYGLTGYGFSAAYQTKDGDQRNVRRSLYLGGGSYDITGCTVSDSYYYDGDYYGERMRETVYEEHCRDKENVEAGRYVEAALFFYGKQYGSGHDFSGAFVPIYIIYAVWVPSFFIEYGVRTIHQFKTRDNLPQYHLLPKRSNAEIHEDEINRGVDMYVTEPRTMVGPTIGIGLEWRHKSLSLGVKLDGSYLLYRSENGATYGASHMNAMVTLAFHLYE